DPGVRPHRNPRSVGDLMATGAAGCRPPCVRSRWNRCEGTVSPEYSGGNAMNATARLHHLGQSLWLDNITRDLLTTGTLQRYITELSVTGLTSNPTIFDHAIKNSTGYDASIRRKLRHLLASEGLFFELALEDITQAADLFRPIWERTSGVDGWVSLEV